MPSGGVRRRSCEISGCSEHRRIAWSSQPPSTQGGTTTTKQFTYDAVGQLTDVTQDGTQVEHYIYDPNGNRLRAAAPAGSVDSTYDAEDRLISSGGTAYTYNADGQLATATTGGDTTSYRYDELGHLTAVTQPDGTHITYVYDGLGRRVGKRVDGDLVQGFLYGSGELPVAETDGAGNVIATFGYSADGVTPDLIATSDGSTYRVITDFDGSPRVIVNTANGNVVEQLSYTAFGVTTTDTTLDWQPFGYAGGLYDPDTGLSYFHARDYSATIGRFLEKDPAGYAGGDTNLYAYVGNDPINSIDPDGTWPCVSCAWHDVTSAASTTFYDTLEVVNDINPMRPVVDAYKREINAYENGCSYWDSVKYGFEGTGYAAGFVATFVVGEGVASLRAARAAYVARAEQIAATSNDARDAVLARNALKAEAREGMPGVLRRAAERRNIAKYGDPLGPTYDQLKAKYGSDAAIIAAAGRTDPFWNGILLI